MSTKYAGVVTVGAIGPMTYGAYIDSVMKSINTLRLSVNPNALGTGPDLMIPTAMTATTLEVVTGIRELHEVLPAFADKLLTLALGPELVELRKILGLHPSGSTPPLGSINCAKLQQEIDQAAGEGIGITLSMQEQFRKMCPGLKFPPRSGV